MRNFITNCEYSAFYLKVILQFISHFTQHDNITFAVSGEESL